jgi:hypothetical protein
MLKNTNLTNPIQPSKQNYSMNAPITKESAERSGSQPTGGNLGGGNMGGYTHNFVPKADKFRTVPCKYYHR